MSYAINNMETHTLEYIFGSADGSIYGGSSLPTLALSCSMLLIIWIAVLVSTLRQVILPWDTSSSSVMLEGHSRCSPRFSAHWRLMVLHSESNPTLWNA
jgi:hypothetical protein